MADMSIKKFSKSFWSIPVLLAIFSVFFTICGWFIFGSIFLKAPHWYMEILLDFCLWPSLLLDAVGLPVTNNHIGFVPNAIGWFMVGIVISAIKFKLAKKR